MKSNKVVISIELSNPNEEKIVKYLKSIGKNDNIIFTNSMSTAKSFDDTDRTNIEKTQYKIFSYVKSYFSAYDVISVNIEYKNV